MQEGNALLAEVLAGRCPVEVLADWLCENYERFTEGKVFRDPKGIDLESGRCALWFAGSQDDWLMLSISFNPTGSSGNWQGESWADCTPERVAGFLSQQLNRLQVLATVED